ncbi:barstar family protein [Frateuria defendens]|uniref:barstar family protein n=1 Tax=Frateuria defendens TaxID=2219559 RepID=UPI00066FFA5D|nr:barstar family protein [Frateuria defendens]
MTTRVLTLDLHDAERNGVYPVAPDDPATLIADAARAGLHQFHLDLAGCRTKPALLRELATALELPPGFGHNWDALSDSLRDLGWLPAPGYALLFDHANELRRAAPRDYATLHEVLTEAAAAWRVRGVPFFAFLEAPDSSTRDTAIDA